MVSLTIAPLDTTPTRVRVAASPEMNPEPDMTTVMTVPAFDTGTLAGLNEVTAAPGDWTVILNVTTNEVEGVP